MNIVQLEKEIEILTDEINDIFHATELNFDAIKIHLEIDNGGENNGRMGRVCYGSTKNALIAQCEKQFNDLKSAYKERSNLRLQYLINEQIKSQEEKVRRERLLQYQDKIYDHRRLICDKESFYDSLIRPKIKRPAGLTNQQFQDFRIKEAEQQEKNNFRQLQEETQMLLKLEKVFRNHRIMLEEQLEKYQKMKNNEEKGQKYQEKRDDNSKERNVQDKDQTKEGTQITRQQQKQRLLKLADSIPIIFQSYDSANTAPINLQTFNQAKKLLSEYMGIAQSERDLMKDYHEEREMYRYLKWEKDDLVEKYKKLQNQLKQLRQKNYIEKQKKRKLST